jgi:hypothetical protein
MTVANAIAQSVCATIGTTAIPVVNAQAKARSV